MRAITRDEINAPLSPKSVLGYSGTSSGRPRVNTDGSMTSINLSDHQNPFVLQQPHHIFTHGFLSSYYPSEPEAAHQSRFVAGTTFFNYNAFGSLRPAQDTIRLFSLRYIGLAIHVFLCGFAFYFFSYGYGRLLAEYLLANEERQVKAANYVLVWPQALSLVIGLASDCVPICGYRRKSYMVLGWILSLSMYLVIIVMDFYGNSGEKLYQSPHKDEFDTNGAVETVGIPSALHTSKYAVPYILVSLVAALGIHISWFTAMAASVEYAQREHLHYRGRLQATLMTLYYGGGVVAQLLTSFVISEGVNSDHLVSTLSVGRAAMGLAIVSAVAIPIVWLCYDEPVFVNTSRLSISMGQRLLDFWKFCHQNVVYRVLFFLILHLFFIGFFNQNVRDAVQKWSGVTRKEALQVEATRHVAKVLAIVAWNRYMRNVSWRKLAFYGTTLFIGAFTVLTFCATYGFVRNEWFYGCMLSVSEIPRAWLLVYAIILATEISDVTREGVTLGLVLSFRSLAGQADYALAAMAPRIIGFKVTMEQVQEDAHETRTRVISAFAIVLAINLLSFLLIVLLPHQKLDAQQMRAFGGYNRHASAALLVLFAVLLCFNLTINLMIVL